MITFTTLDKWRKLEKRARQECTCCQYMRIIRTNLESKHSSLSCWMNHSWSVFNLITYFIFLVIHKECSKEITEMLEKKRNSARKQATAFVSIPELFEFFRGTPIETGRWKWLRKFHHSWRHQCNVNLCFFGSFAGLLRPR